MWEGVGDWTKTAAYWPPSSSGHSSVSFRSPGLLNRGPGAQLSAKSLFSLLHLEHCLKFWTATAQSRIPRAPSDWCCSLYIILSPTDSNFLCNELYYCFTPTQSLPITGQRNMQLPPSLEWHVWSSSSGKKLSCSSQVPLFRCISLWLNREILTLSHIVSQARLRNLFP